MKKLATTLAIAGLVLASATAAQAATMTADAILTAGGDISTDAGAISTASGDGTLATPWTYNVSGNLDLDDYDVTIDCEKHVVITADALSYDTNTATAGIFDATGTSNGGGSLSITTVNDMAIRSINTQTGHTPITDTKGSASINLVSTSGAINIAGEVNAVNGRSNNSWRSGDIAIDAAGSVTIGGVITARSARYDDKGIGKAGYSGDLTIESGGDITLSSDFDFEDFNFTGGISLTTDANVYFGGLIENALDVSVFYTGTGTVYFDDTVVGQDVAGLTAAGFTAVPEPGTMILLAAGGLGALARRRRRKPLTPEPPTHRHAESNFLSVATVGTPRRRTCWRIE